MNQVWKENECDSAHIHHLCLTYSLHYVISHPRSGSRFVSLCVGMSLSIGFVGDVGMSVSIGSAGDAIRCMSDVHTTDNEHTDCWTHAREMSATH